MNALINALRSADVFEVDGSPLLHSFDECTDGSLAFRFVDEEGEHGLDIPADAAASARIKDHVVKVEDEGGHTISILLYVLTPFHPGNTVSESDGSNGDGDSATTAQPEALVLPDGLRLAHGGEHAPQVRVEADPEVSVDDLHEGFEALVKRENAIFEGAVAAGTTDSASIRELVERELGESHHWPNALVRPIAKAWEQLGWFARVEVLGPFGLGPHIAFHCYANSDDEQPSRTLTLTPDLRDYPHTSVLQKVDHTSDTGAYREGSVGRVNGLHYERKPISNAVRLDDWAFWDSVLDTV